MLVRPRDLPTAAEMQANPVLNRFLAWREPQLEDRPARPKTAEEEAEGAVKCIRAFSKAVRLIR